MKPFFEKKDADYFKKREMFCILIFFFCLTVFLLFHDVSAKVGGAIHCSTCHTMHNSEGGQPIARDDYGNPMSIPYSSLLKSGCIGCHSASGGSTWRDTTSKAPIVFNLSEPNFNAAKGLAGGNFYYVSGLDTGNNGHSIFNNNLNATPPGGTDTFPVITCAGTYGCHGHNGRQSGDTAVDEVIDAVKKAHHGDDTPPLTGSLTDVAKNYRFLLGIIGKEDSDWEADYINTSHNEYKGSTNFTTATTMSFFCGECHGNFHDGTFVGTSSPWIRHPTDIALPNSGEYSGYTSYSMLAPVARPEDNYTGSASQVRPGTDVIMCLSCHRAHASPYYKMLRWNYKSTDLATALSGCNVCHTGRN